MAGQPRVMKQVLLRVTAVLAKIRVRKLAQPLRCDLPLARKIAFPQDALDPDVNRECTQTFVSEKHHTISNLRADARQFTQARLKIDIGQHVDLFKIEISASDEPRSFQQILRAIEHSALAQA